MTEAVKAPSLGDVIGAAAFGVGLATAWLYVAGWSYAYEYFDSFHIPLLLTDVPREHLFVYGGLTISKNPIWSLAVTITLGLVVWFCVWRRASLGRSILVGILVVITIALFVLARVVGVTTAQMDAAFQRNNDFPAFPRVMIELTGQGEAAGLALNGCARLVLATEERVFLVVPRRGAPALELNTVMLPAETIASMTLSGQYVSCS